MIMKVIYIRNIAFMKKVTFMGEQNKGLLELGRIFHLTGSRDITANSVSNEDFAFLLQTYNRFWESMIFILRLKFFI